MSIYKELKHLQPGDTVDIYFSSIDSLGAKTVSATPCDVVVVEVEGGTTKFEFYDRKSGDKITSKGENGEKIKLISRIDSSTGEEIFF